MALKRADASEIAAFLACATQSDLASVLGTTRERMLFHLYSRKAPSYHVFGIPKASGGLRKIASPPPAIAVWQKYLARLLGSLYERKPAVHGFAEGMSIGTNADRHVRKNLILSIDLIDFFPSIHFGRVRGMFLKPPFNFIDTVASTLAQLCTYKGRLPQGAPCSPIISNLICRSMDNELDRVCRKLGCTYTRYADDITISTTDKALPSELVASYAGDGSQVVIGHKLAATIGKHKFLVNPAKSRIRARQQSQEVTGLVVNVRRNVPRSYVEKLRAVLHDVRQAGYMAAEVKHHALSIGRSRRRPGSPSLRNHIFGKLEFLRMVRGSGDAVHARYALQARRLNVLEFPVRVTGQATRHIELLRQTVWLVVGKDVSGGENLLGTAFASEGGFISARHILDRDPVMPMQSWWIQRSYPPYDSYVISEMVAHPSIDMAVLRTDAVVTGFLEVSATPCFMGQRITLVGFPNAHSLADFPLRADDTIVQQMPLSTFMHYSVVYPLLHGASGGPVLNEAGHVVGVIVHTVHSHVLPNAFIDIGHLAAVQSSGSTIALP